MINVDLLLSTLFFGLILSMVAMSIMIPFRVLDCPDLSAEGAYPLGGAITAICFVSDMGTLATIICAMLSGALFGLGTSLLNRVLKLNTLLCGILMCQICYSIDLRLLGVPNVSLYQVHTLYLGNATYDLFITLGLVLLICAFVYYLLNTVFGLRMKAYGFNPLFIKFQNLGESKLKIVGFMIASAISALGGSLMVQSQKYMDINMGSGIVVFGLASLMMGEVLFKDKPILSVVLGSIIFSAISSMVLSLGLMPSDLKGICAIVVLGILVLRNHTKLLTKPQRLCT